MLRSTPTTPSHSTDIHEASESAYASRFRRIGIVNDHLRVSYANGSSFASQFLRREFVRRGHEVTLVGPADSRAEPGDLPPNHVSLRSFELRNHPGVNVPFPTRTAMKQLADRKLDILLGQTCTGMLQFGTWLRRRHHVPYVCVNTVHLPSVYNVVLPDRAMARPSVRRLFEDRIIPAVESTTVAAYNGSDGLVVLSEGLKNYWEKRGVTVPIHVISRSVEPKIFSNTSDPDPFDERATPGARLLCVCRHTREKGLEQMLRIFAHQIAPNNPKATLTLVGDGPDHDAYVAQALHLGVADRVFFPREVPLQKVPAYYRHADLFLYTSLSDTYGQVVSEAAWCGLPCVGLDDDMGVSHQISDGKTGFLVSCKGSARVLEENFGRQVLNLLSNDLERRAMGQLARESANHRAAPERSIAQYYEAFDVAREHLDQCKAAGSRAISAPKLARWTAMHAAAVGLGYLRPRVDVNKNGSRQPGWEDLQAPRGIPKPRTILPA